MYKKNHTYITKHNIYKGQEIKIKKETRNIKRRKEKKSWGSHYVIQSIERHNPFKLFSLYTFYTID